MGVLERIRELVGKGGISIPTLEDAAVGTPRGARTRADDRRAPGLASDGIVVTEEYRAVDEAIRAGAPIVFVTGGAGSGKSTSASSPGPPPWWLRPGSPH